MEKTNKYLSFDIPILFIIFRRKNTATKVIEAVSKIRPKKLYISQDGPRSEEEQIQVEETRKVVLSKINWKCDLTVWTHDKNLGLRKHIPEAFDKFFEKEKMGIYLEDDTLPNRDFFYYQQELLKKYLTDTNIFSISGTNLYSNLTKTKDSYYLSKIGSCWGMGIWKRSWRLYDRTLASITKNQKNKQFDKKFFSKKYKFYITTFINVVKNKKLDSWAFPLVYSAIENDKFFIIPRKNMVINIGLYNQVSNFNIQDYGYKFEKSLPLKHPKLLKYDSKNDIVYFNNMMRGGWARLILIKVFLFLPLRFKEVIKKIISNAQK